MDYSYSNYWCQSISSIISNNLSNWFITLPCHPPLPPPPLPLPPLPLDPLPLPPLPLWYGTNR